MRLIIAEKPSVAQAIAGVIGGAKRSDGFIDCPQAKTRVTWCFGHLLEQAKPEDYVDGGKVLASHLPVIPTTWKLSPRDGGAGNQVKVIRDLLKDATEMVNAGDADREGQLLVDEVLLFLNWKGKTSRLWLSSLDDASVRKALSSIKDNAAMRPVYESALARQRADWLMGMNCSIALSRNLQACGMPGAWSIGRVQTPTLALLVDRQREIGHFKPRDFYQVVALLDGGIRAAWQTRDDLVDEDGRLLDKARADATSHQITGKAARVTRYTRKTGERSAPLPYTLGGLQKAASSRLGLSAKDTLAAAQELYEAKVTTYPRTDCPYLPIEMHGGAAGILKAIGGTDIAGIDPERKHAAWNTAKVEAHHGLIPTGQSPDAAGLSADAKRVFGLIRESYIRLFIPPEKFETREAIFDIDGLTFRAAARVVLDPGWTKLGGRDEDEGQEQGEAQGALPDLREGEARTCERGEVVAKRTTPPKPYTDGTLIAAMTGVHKLVTDPKLKARLKETSGLGTEATRASMIETLIAREYAERSKKEIHPTDRGAQLIDMLRKVAPEVADPGYTALQEDALADIAAGRAPLAAFMRAQVDATREFSRTLLDGRLTDQSIAMHACPACGGARCAKLTSKAGNAYHRCMDCQAAFGDAGGKPGKRFEDRPQGDGAQKTSSAAATGPKCPICKKPTFKNETKTGKAYYRCGGCRVAWWPERKDESKLGTKWEAMK
ncbi:DNA topoisomerase 3 [Thiomonas arsenitoxydans]|uniref:DNA topoisomerase n=1 Tax=Thiomonas arsenitoxydans (strain DSM 22701 / CIP 110005 / 3As) TaxID=426114 RepID=D6CUI6_THIA3|nr:DNA topoisomerase 3 [Thiomonas arsenitoxydans]CAZ88955.1 putative DNA topoisomerase III (TopB) [Thiomonas arsenitoxydans]CQR29530.1 DNA topoisomerase 3 [Thiomonas arsenitoxydans]CQR34892.1 DNA topoisomerase 3 [Thiomonas arsenitoxydans]CQR35936.1 DNA topoisomerase 3 [Thiomonas arsenitoxydans]CQR36026.1 DNA topoisomerase 3 [Thiomonas arsenitoxydans]